MRRIAFDWGRWYYALLVSYHLPQGGQLQANKVLSHHSGPSSLSAWGLGIHVSWIMVCIKHSFCMGNWPLTRGYKGNLIFALRTSAKGTWGQWTWTSIGGKISPKIAHVGEAIYTYLKWGKEKQSLVERKQHGNIRVRASSHLFVAIETVTHVWASTTLTDAVPPSAAEVLFFEHRCNIYDGICNVSSTKCYRRTITADVIFC